VQDKTRLLTQSDLTTRQVIEGKDKTIAALTSQVRSRTDPKVKYSHKITARTVPVANDAIGSAHGADGENRGRQQQFGEGF